MVAIRALVASGVNSAHLSSRPSPDSAPPGAASPHSAMAALGSTKYQGTGSDEYTADSGAADRNRRRCPLHWHRLLLSVPDQRSTSRLARNTIREREPTAGA